jgi:hypothetical protein
MNDLIFTEKKWILAHNEGSILHYVELEAGQHFASGQPVVEIFDDFVDCVDKIVDLGFDPDEVICKPPYEQNIQE